MEYRDRGGSHYHTTHSGRDTSARCSLPSPPEKERPKGRPFGAISEQKLRSQLSEWRSTTGKPGGEIALRKKQLEQERNDATKGFAKHQKKAKKAIKSGGNSVDGSNPVRKIAEGVAAPLAARINEQLLRGLLQEDARTEKRPDWFIVASVLGPQTIADIAVRAMIPFLLDDTKHGGETQADGITPKRQSLTAMSRKVGEAVIRTAWIAASKPPGKIITPSDGKGVLHSEAYIIDGVREEATKRYTGLTEDTVAAGIGRLLWEWVCETSNGLVKLVGSDGDDGRRNHRHYLEVSQELTDWLVEAVGADAINAPPGKRAMICPPTPWVGPAGGGHLLRPEDNHLVTPHYLRQGRLVANAIDGEPPEKHLAAVNTLQAVPYIVNSLVLNVANAARRNGYGLDLKPLGELPKLPPKPTDEDAAPSVADATEATRKVRWREWYAVRDTRKKMAAKQSMEWRTRQEAGRLRGEVFGFEHFCDFRGRMYAATGYGPHPQGDDFARHVLLFAEGKAIGKDTGQGSGPWYLARQVAKAWGQDKLPILEQVVWVRREDTERMLRTIVHAARHDLRNFKGWVEDWREDLEKHGGDPWAALAAADEWVRYLDAVAKGEGPKFVTRLPCYIDGTCNGLQHYAALSRDRALAELVNLENGPRKQDIYREVAITLQSRAKQEAENGSEHAEFWLSVFGEEPPRGFAKDVVMIKPYGAGKKAVKKAVRKYWAEKGCDERSHSMDDKAREALRNWLVKEVRKAVDGRTVPADRIMEFLQKCSDLLSEEHKIADGPAWVSPSGWPWRNAYLATKDKTPTITVGETKLPFSMKVEIPGVPCVEDQRTGIAPNFVHALDAAALVAAINTIVASEVANITAIHDSVGGLAPDMDIIAKAVREGFIEVHESEPLEQFREAVLAALPGDAWADVPALPKRGDFDIKRMMNSDYFFC